MDLQWVMGPKRQKAKKISDETWQEHEENIREMFGVMTLDQLIANMKMLHGFEATPRQYSTRLEGWGLKKYKTKPTVSDNESSEFSESSPDQCGIALIDAQRPAVDAPKRRRSAQDVGNRDSLPSVSELSKNKKSKTGQQVVADSSPECEKGNDCVLTTGSAVSEASGNSSLRTDSSRPISVIQTKSQPPWPPSQSLPEPLADSFLGRWRTITTDEFLKTISLKRCVIVAQDAEVCVRSGSKPSTKLREDMGTSLRKIADYLFALGYFKEAANLYILLLLDEQSGFSSGKLLTYYLIMCARSARTSAQYDIVQNILSKRLSWFTVRGVLAAERFLAHILKAKMFARQGNRIQGTRNIGAAQRFADDIAEMGDCLLHHSMDILVYIHYKRLHSVSATATFLDPTLLKTDPSNTKTLRSVETTPISHHDFKILRLFLQPEQSFEHKIDIWHDGKVLAGLMEESFTWCLETVKQHRNLSILWKMPDCIKPTQLGIMTPPPWENSQTQGGSNPGTRVDEATLSMRLFERLWKQWETDFPSNQPSPNLGISVAEHLHICSELIIQYGVEHITGLMSEDLVDTYLRRLYDRMEQMNEISLLLGPYQKAPGLSAGQTESHGNYMLTMASSIRSSDLSMGRMRDAERAMRQRAARGSCDTMTSTTSRIWRESASIDRLSDQFESFSLYSPSWARSSRTTSSTTTHKTIATEETSPEWI
ncbi:hypothetical protein BKA67DRAFT_99175 [Truncatella angustata]|uniref:Clr5 domain-containing protein n=1 Tax=Truncatella angustata TaxID=152316 RepID=A0A9P8U9I1_9PEZI|nr:uncharacterized protein BKA67DRAFT_99175 [Truncatella angustata]KAH6646324.1 hypothetical protein BKA67DRAFT_99175 [Truncatella angustata]KAH8201152.1 hypothetical protein TruAng_004702 [Truncatella angustata]